MKKITLVAAVLAAAIAGSAIAEPASVRVILSVVPKKTLPGLAVPLTLHIENRVSSVQLAPSVQVRATSPAGDSFIANWADRLLFGSLEFGLDDEADESHDLKLSPGSIVDLAIPATDFNHPSWAHDERLMSLTGDWKLEVLLFANGDTSNPIAVSNVAPLAIQTPSTRDTAILQLMRTRQYGVWGTAEKVFLEYQDSPYFPYFATLVPRRTTQEQLEIVKRAIALHPNTPVLPWLRYSLALTQGILADDAFDGGNGDFENAVAIAEKGRAELTKLTNSNDPWSILKGKKQMGDFPSREGYEDELMIICDKSSRKPKKCPIQ